MLNVCEPTRWNPPPSQDPFGTRDADLSRIDFRSDPNGASRCLENRFRDVMGVAAVMKKDMEIAVSIRCEGLPKVFDQLAIELANLRRWHRGLEYQIGPAAEIDRRSDECLLHRQDHMPVAADTRFVT